MEVIAGDEGKSVDGTDRKETSVIEEQNRGGQAMWPLDIVVFPGTMDGGDRWLDIDTKYKKFIHQM